MLIELHRAQRPEEDESHQPAVYTGNCNGYPTRRHPRQDWAKSQGTVPGRMWANSLASRVTTACLNLGNSYVEYGIVVAVVKRSKGPSMSLSPHPYENIPPGLFDSN